jgi:hypothetical protein
MCGCKGCQEITTLDLANNTETITQLPTTECGPIDSTVKILTCACGITLDIYNGAGVLIESNQSGGYITDSKDQRLFFEFTNSTVWESELGTNYILTITYNSELGRWELTYYDETYDSNIVIGVYYSANSCPTSLTEWDLDCISFIFRPRTTNYIVTWNGLYINGKKTYSIYCSAESRTFDIYWDDVDNRWEIVPDVISPSYGSAYNDSTSNCVPTNVVWSNIVTGTNTGYQTFPPPLNLTGYNARVTPIDCQCCDEKLTLNITLNTESGNEELEVIADIVTNEAGNHLIYNGYPYYIFYIGEEDYFLFYLDGQWVVKSVLSISAPLFTSMESTSECPFGYYLVNRDFLRFWVRGYDCGNQTEEDFCNKVHEKQCEFATKTLKYLKHLQFGNTCCEELDALKNDKRILEILNCYDTRDIPANTTNYNTIPYIQIKRLLGC